MAEQFSRDAMEYLVDLGTDGAEIQTFEVDDRLFYRDAKGQLIEIKPLEPDFPPCLDVYSLTGFIDFLKRDLDGVIKLAEQITVQVVSPTSVYAFMPADGIRDITRNALAKCSAKLPNIPFDSYHDAEDFVIMLQTRFLETDNRDLILKLVSSMTEVASEEVADDGFSQKVTIKQGISMVGNVVVKNPAILMPIRTFHEVEQPESPFVLRFAQNHNVALFEADGGAWKNEAVANVVAYLKGHLDEKVFSIIG